jgi:limonene-1,2-epoxide hydrolase
MHTSRLHEAVEFLEPRRVTMNLEEKKSYVRAFYKSWETIPFANLSKRYREYLSEDVVLEIPGLPPFVGIEQAAAFMDSFAKEFPDLVSVTVDIKTCAADGDLVFNERVDAHCDASGTAQIVVAICSAMEIRNGKICRWKEYLDPSPFHAATAK